MSRDACLNDPLLLVLLVAGNLVIFAAYIAVPAVMVWVAVRSKVIPFPVIWVLLGGFILSCGITHLVGAIVFFRPAWYLETAIVLVTGFISAISAALLWARRRLFVASLEDFANFQKVVTEQKAAE